jgi:hypothetical protein
MNVWRGMISSLFQSGSFVRKASPTISGGMNLQKEKSWELRKSLLGLLGFRLQMLRVCKMRGELRWTRSYRRMWRWMRMLMIWTRRGLGWRSWWGIEMKQALKEMVDIDEQGKKMK